MSKLNMIEKENHEVRQLNKTILKENKKDKVNNQNSNNKIEKMKQQYTELEDKYNTAVKVKDEMKREIETLNKHLKIREKDLGTRDNRMNKLMEENEKLKINLKKTKETHEFNDNSKELEELKNMNKLLEKQRDEM